MFYNKKKQPFTIENRFTITSEGELVHYCRVKFYNTKKIQIISSEQFNTGDFEDESLIIQEELAEPVEVEGKPLTNEPVVQDDITSIGEPVEPSFAQMILITKPNGSEVEIELDELETFCKDNKLDLEAIQSVLEGKQKTHRKFRFKLL